VHTYILCKMLGGVRRHYHGAENSKIEIRTQSDFNLLNFAGTRVIFAEVTNRDPEVVVYTSAQSLLRLLQKCAL